MLFCKKESIIKETTMRNKMKTFSEIVQDTIHSLETLPKNLDAPYDFSRLIIVEHIKRHLNSDGIINPDKKLIDPVIQPVLEHFHVESVRDAFKKQ